MQAVKTIAGIVGIYTILAPVWRTVLFAGQEKGESIGGGGRLRSWQFVLGMTIGFIAVGFLLWKPIPLDLNDAPFTIIFWCGSLTYFSGIALYLWGFFQLDRSFAVSSALGVDLNAGHKLILGGPYRYIRHPMYLGVMLAALGGLLLFRTWSMVLFAPMSLVVIRRAKLEDRLLESVFDDMWHAYADKTPAWIPRIRRRRNT